MKYYQFQDTLCAINNDDVFRFIVEFEKNGYKLGSLTEFISFLDMQSTFQFPMLENGLFPAAILDASTEYTGYSSVWVRDNIFISYSYYVTGLVDVSLKNILTLSKYFIKHKYRFENIIEKIDDLDNPMARPHVRFNGKNLSEIDQPWEHAQNDALAYFVWFLCKLINEGRLTPSIEHMELLGLFCAYFQAISYWKDQDSGHWEEARKIEASSIGVVIAALKSCKQVLINKPNLANYCHYKNTLVNVELLETLIKKGSYVLEAILPFECIQPEKKRDYDSALLFLCYPLKVVNIAMAKRILENVTRKLQGEADRPFGIRRYLNDTFWCRDYEDIPENIRTSISSEREHWLQRNGRAPIQGEEAQWCIFDPIISTIYGIEFQRTREKTYFNKQISYFYRSIGQLTPNDFQLGSLRCPELYYINKGHYVPNDATPLLWTQANLKIAVQTLENSLLLLR